MELTYTADEEAFRLRIRDWIAKNQPQSEGRPGTEELRRWQRRL